MALMYVVALIYSLTIPLNYKELPVIPTNISVARMLGFSYIQRSILQFISTI